MSDSFNQKSPYPIVNTVVLHLSKWEHEDLMAKTVLKKLASPNVKLYLGPLGKLMSGVEEVLYSDG